MSNLRSESSGRGPRTSATPQMVVPHGLEQPISRWTARRNERCSPSACGRRRSRGAAHRILDRLVTRMHPLPEIRTARNLHRHAARARRTRFSALVPDSSQIVHTLCTPHEPSSASAASTLTVDSVARRHRRYTHDSDENTPSAADIRAVETPPADPMRTLTTASSPPRETRESERGSEALAEDPFPERTGWRAARHIGVLDREQTTLAAPSTAFELLHRVRSALSARPASDPVPPSSPVDSIRARRDSNRPVDRARRGPSATLHVSRDPLAASSIARRSGPGFFVSQVEPFRTPTGSSSGTRSSTSGRTRLRAPQRDHQG